MPGATSNAAGGCLVTHCIIGMGVQQQVGLAGGYLQGRQSRRARQVGAGSVSLATTTVVWPVLCVREIGGWGPDLAAGPLWWI